MICILCKQSRALPGQTTATLERGDLRLVVTSVPALICPTCGETYTDEDTATRLLTLADEMQNAGLEADVRVYEASGRKI